MNRFLSLPSVRLVFLALCIAIPPAAHATDTEEWARLASLRPLVDLQMKTLAKAVDPGMQMWQPQKIEDGNGPLVLDSFSLIITKRPVIDGKVLDDGAILERIRLQLGNFVDPSVGSFSAADADDKTRWEMPAPAPVAVPAPKAPAPRSRNPAPPKAPKAPPLPPSGTGAVMIFDLKLPGNPPGVDKAAVLLTESSTARWTLSSIYSGRKEVGGNPWSGSRTFTIRSAAPFEGCVLDIHGAHRAAQALSPDGQRAALEALRAFWSGVLGKVAAFVKESGGEALPDMISASVGMAPWDEVKEALHAPTGTWHDISGSWASAEKDQRFRVEFKGLTGQCDFVERTRNGREIRTTVPFKVIVGDPISYVIERPNTSREVLDFYDFSAGTQEEILKSDPKPSTLTLTMAKGKLRGLWRGLSVTSDGKGKIKDIKQPGTSAAKPYEFVPYTEPPPPPPGTPATPAAPGTPAVPTAPPATPSPASGATTRP